MPLHPSEQQRWDSLTLNQCRMLRLVRDKQGSYRCRDGNEERTARSLKRRGLVEWFPPGTHANLIVTERGSAVLSWARAEGRL